MQKLPSVGERYDPARSRYPETASWRLSVQHGAELMVSVPAPDQRMIDAVHGRAGAARFALITQPDVLVLATRFGEQTGWIEGAWQAIRQDPGYPPGLSGGDGHLVVRIHLVDALTGLVAAQSLVTWPPAFAAAVRTAIGEQLAGTQDDTAASHQLDALRRRYPTVAKLVRETATTTCTGGAAT
ncbi:hypothetical protein [Marinactinospora rubrisoli]|uniref:Uncharacterized protein n=1 Tax=Marinactinospora rubrisoli TaxID=2715399 RepID=A0ABW2KQ07_9ACTN